MKLRMLSLVIVSSVGALVGCAAENAGQDAATRSDGTPPSQQRYHIDLVRARAADLRPGMSKAEVYVLLGAPAEYRGDTWLYRGGADGDDVFRVRFKDDRYVESSAG